MVRIRGIFFIICWCCDSGMKGYSEKHPQKFVDPKGSFSHRSERIAWRGGKAYKVWAGSEATGPLSPSCKKA